MRGGGDLLLVNANFRRLWLGETLSSIGSQVSGLAIPVIAISTLSASPTQVGMLVFLQRLPVLLMGPFIGVLLDRRALRPVMVTANLVRGFLLLLVAALATLGLLSVTALLVLSFVLGAWTSVFEVAYLSFLPRIAAPWDLYKANARLMASATTADVAGPSLAGVLIDVLSAPLALVADAATFITAGLLGRRIAVVEPSPQPQQGGVKGVLREARAGFALVVRDRRIAPMAYAASAYNFFEQAITTLFIVYALGDLGLTTGTLGLLLSAGGVGAVVGSVLAGRTAEGPSRWHLLGGSLLLSAGGLASLPLVDPRNGGTVRVAVAAGLVMYGVGIAVFNVNAVALRQQVIEAHALSRVTASYRFLTYGTLSLGGLAGGLLGDAVGVRLALLLLGSGVVLSTAIFALYTSLSRVDA